MNVHVKIFHKHTLKTFSVPENECISVLLRDEGFIAFPCGVGKCGKCRIKANSTPTKEEIEKLREEDIKNGIRLACYTRNFEGLEVTLLEENKLSVLTSYKEQEFECFPCLEKRLIEIPMPTLEDQRDDLTRLLQASKLTKHALNLKDLIFLSESIHKNKDSAESIFLSILTKEDTLVGISPSKKHLAIAVDIGTTTIAATLIDLTQNTILTVCGEANEQASYGADVISRINQTIKETTPDYQKNIKSLQELIVAQINSLKIKLLEQARNEGFICDNYQDVDYFTIAGNTTMMHFLCALPAVNISRAPFIPVVTEPMFIRASQINLDSNAYLFLMPSIASYVGADIVAAMLAVNAHEQKEPFVLLDLGTNAEIVLGYNGKFLSCSAAAGPCFEGASLSCGLPGQNGAINHIKISDNDIGFEYSTINNQKAKGICGSGVLDLIALMLKTNIIDETGMINEPEDISLDYSKLKKAIITTKNDQTAFLLADDIAFTQRDIREVQLAKSAVRAGIHTLIEEAGLDISYVKNLYIAGGFGSAMSTESAALIGLIPPELLHCAKAIGNAASLGVIRYAMEKDVKNHVEYIVKNSTYLELSSLPTFTNLYVEHMVFLKTD